MVENQGRRYPLRERRAPRRFPDEEHVLLTDEGEPETFEEEKEDTHSRKWLSAMQDEMDSLHENHTYELTEVPKDKRALRNKWVYKLKPGDAGNPPRYIPCSVVKGFQKKKRLDFDEIFSQVVKMTSIWTVLSIAASMDLEVEQLEVKTEILHGDFEEKINMQQPEGFVKKGTENLVCRLKKSLYRLKQTTRHWYRKFDSFMADHGYHKTQADDCVFVMKFDGGDFLILLLYVEDMLIVGRNPKKMGSLKKAMRKSFAMKDVVQAKQILGMHIVRDRTKKLLWLSQEKYVKKVLQRFSMSDAKPVGSTLPTNCKLSGKQSPKT